MKAKIIVFISFWPTIYAFIYFATITAVFIKLGDKRSTGLEAFCSVIDSLRAPTSWIYYGTVIWLLLQIFKFKIVPEEKRLDWGAAIFFLGLISIPIFWFKFLRVKKDIEPNIPVGRTL